jgi:hypothetical protein
MDSAPTSNFQQKRKAPNAQGPQRKTPVHGAAWGRMGPDMGPVKKIARPKKKRRAAGCYLLRWHWANNPLQTAGTASKYPTPTDLFITDPTCAIAGRD